MSHANKLQIKKTAYAKAFFLIFKGKFENDYQDKTPQKKIPQKKYSVNHT